VVVGGDLLFVAQRDQLAALAVRHGIPAIYGSRPQVTAGGLMSYGTDDIGLTQIAGNYTARILQGEKPANLPVQLAIRRWPAAKAKSSAMGHTLAIGVGGRHHTKGLPCRV
jgi:putative tryptophan/tyrosine transport system substrate-binding protein